MRFATLATVVASLTSLAFAQSSSWDTWNPQSHSGPPAEQTSIQTSSTTASIPVTTTVTLTLLNFNETLTSTSYSASSTSHTITYASVTTHTTAAPIATFSAGAATNQEVNIAVAAVAGIGAVIYGLY